MSRNMLTELGRDETGSTTIKSGMIAALTSLLAVTVLSATGNSPASVLMAAITEFENALGG